MNLLADTLLVLLLLTVFLLLGSSRLGTGIRVGALQGILVGLLPLAESGAGATGRMAVMAGAMVALKGFAFPRLLFRALRESGTRREVQPLVGYLASIFFMVASLLASFWLDARIRVPSGAAGGLVLPVAYSMMMAGLFLIVARRTAVNQVVGYLVLENGIYTFGSAIVPDVPMLIELGVLMDVFVAVFVMGIAIFHINREFDHIDANLLNTLKG